MFRKYLGDCLKELGVCLGSVSGRWNCLGDVWVVVRAGGGWDVFEECLADVFGTLGVGGRRLGHKWDLLGRSLGNVWGLLRSRKGEVVQDVWKMSGGCFGHHFQTCHGD